MSIKITNTGEMACSKFMLPLLMGIYSLGELGHFLIGVTSRDVAQDIGYGDKGCLSIPDMKLNLNLDSSIICKELRNETGCVSARATNDLGYAETRICEWNYNGLGTDYQILAGPAFMLCFTTAGVLWGLVGDRINRVYLLGGATLIYGVAIAGTSLATRYWHLVLFRISVAIGASASSPLGAGIIGDIFGKERRALAMGVFNWGIYLGYGGSFAIGTYIPDTTLFEQRWRTSFLISGIPGVLMAILFICTMTEPRNGKSPGPEPEESGEGGDQIRLSGEISKVKVVDRSSILSNPVITSPKSENAFLAMLKRPEILILGLAACIRHASGYCWGYNSTLYFQTYYPEYDAGWWLFGFSIGGGLLGSVIGGVVSDLLVNRMGISSRALVLAGSQFFATPFSVGLLYLAPPYAFISLFLGYLLSEMWFSAMYAILVELVPENCKSTAVALALFVINNAGGNLPVLVGPLTSLTDYRTAIMIMYSGALLASSFLFFLCWILLRRKY